MSKQVAVDAEAVLKTIEHNGVQEVLADLAYKRLALVNLLFYGLPNAGDRQWVLIDAGLMGTAGAIRQAAVQRFGADARPAAIVLTHGHFDHVGALLDLAEEWDAPVYAHELELPYLNGGSAYPPPDPTVGGGIMSVTSPLYPRGPIKVGARLHQLPAGGTVPHMAGWRWIATPGHTPGHISLWREEDRSLIVGDAFITTRQESAFAVATQAPELHGPPMYYTMDWAAAERSVVQLAALEPELVVAGHGQPMHGAAMREALHKLADHFAAIAVPEQGRYVNQPAKADASGVTYIPPKP